MKVKIKGLVFTGFAAAILSANAFAAADDNIVTSKSYVDSKYTATDGLTIADGTGADAGKKVITNTGVRGVLASDQNDAEGTIRLNVGGEPIVYPVKNVEVTGHKVAQSTDTGAAPALNTSSNVDNDKYPTTLAVKAYVDSKSATGNFIEDAVTSGVVTKAPTEDAVYNFVTIKNVTANGSALSVDSDTKTVNIPVMTGSTENTAGVAGLVPVSSATEQDKVLTAGGTWIAKQNEQATANKFQVSKDKAWSDITNAVSGDNAYVATSSDATTGGVKVELTNVTDSYDATNWNSAGSTDNLTTEAAVYGAIQAATGGTVIPAQNPSVCTASTPCALVAEYNSTNTAMELHWRTMATDSHAGGSCGDAAGTGCNTGI